MGSALGAKNERIAERYLIDRGLRLLARNHRCRLGELDLVMRDGDTLVFVEVRYRRSARYGTPAETVDYHKQRRLAAVAGHFLQTHPTELACRFDVVAIAGPDRIQWIKNAFNADD